MRTALATAALLFAAPLFAASDRAEVSARYFERTREIKAAHATKPPYLAIDEAIWNGSQNKLGDIRVYDAGKEVPYAMVTECAKYNSGETVARILNKGQSSGATEFVIESPAEEFDTVKVELKTKDFTAQAKVVGADELPAKQWSELGTFTLFDFTKEELGRNWTIKLKSRVRFKYLQIRISEPVKPEDVLQASISDRQDEKAKYTAWSAQPEIKQERNKTVITWPGSEKVPLEHVEFTIDPSEVNFSRPVTLACDDGSRTHGELTRVRMTRKQHKVEYESHELFPGMLKCKSYTAEIVNGDDPPLKITSVTPQTIERRVYWKVDAAATPKLYYGDKKAASPQYDFAKFFDEPDDAVRAALGPESQNAEYSERPDDRPWSERNSGVMWVALVVAVAGLGAWALKGFKA